MMFDPGLCQEISSTKAWTLVSRSLLFVLSRPLIAIALLSAIALLPIAVIQPKQRPKWGKRSLALGIAALLFYILITTSALSSIGSYFLMRYLPANSTESADAIVVLGRGDEQNQFRAQRATELWRSQRAPLIFISGRRDTPIIIDLLRQAQPPIDSDAIAGEPCSLTTEQNAQFTAAILWPQGIRKIVLMTDQPHMRRSQLTFESFGFTVIPHVIPFETSNRAEKNFLAIRESLGLVSYGWQGRYNPQDIPPMSIIEGN